MKYNRCANCGFTILDLDGGIFLGHTLDYWIDLQARVDEIDATKLVEEIVRLKAKLFDYQAIEKLYKDIK